MTSGIFENFKIATHLTETKTATTATKTEMATERIAMMIRRTSLTCMHNASSGMEVHVVVDLRNVKCLTVHYCW